MERITARKLGAALAAALALAGLAGTATVTSASHSAVEQRTLDGSDNNQAHPDWGQAGTQYTRVAAANYADGISSMVGGPNTRYVSNRVFNDVGRNIFSENRVTQWGWAWGQFMDHDLGLRDETPAESADIAFDSSDPLEGFTNDFGAIGFDRTPAAPGTGVSTPRQQINTISSYIDASNVYGVDAGRLDWLREGSDDGDPTDNDASLLLPGSYLPQVGARGDSGSAPEMDLMGQLMGNPEEAIVAGDVRANENIALTALHTLFAREHNRIVDALPASLSEQRRFEVARRIVGAELQWITHQEFLPALGIELAPYGGYDPDADAGLANEFAVVGYRAHSMIHGEFEVVADAGTYSAAQIDDFEDQGIEVAQPPGEVELTIPLTVAFGNPELLRSVGLGPMSHGLGLERQYRNDEQIDDTLRSVLFQVPRPGIADPSVCASPVVNPDCFAGVVDLGAIDVERGRDHGMPTYNDLRAAYGLPRRDSFRAVTGEPTERFPNDPQINQANPIDDPDILDFVELRNEDGNLVPPGPGGAEDVVFARRRSTLAARLRAIYGDVDDLDAFTGMVSEPHLPGAEFGELQAAIWRAQFEALRDGDRFFYLNDPELEHIRQQHGIDYRTTLAEVIERNAGVDVEPNVFLIADEAAEPAPADPVAQPPGDSGDEESDDGNAKRKKCKAKKGKAKKDKAAKRRAKKSCKRKKRRG